MKTRESEVSGHLCADTGSEVQGVFVLWSNVTCIKETRNVRETRTPVCGSALVSQPRPRGHMRVSTGTIQAAGSAPWVAPGRPQAGHRTLPVSALCWAKLGVSSFTRFLL